MVHTYKKFKKKISLRPRHIKRLRSLKKTFKQHLPTFSSRELSECVGKSEILRPFKIKFTAGEMNFFNSSERPQDGIKFTLDKMFQALQVNVSQTSTFSGNYNAQSFLTMSVRDFFDYQGSLHLYMAQQPLYKRFTRNNTIFTMKKSKKDKSLILGSINEAQEKILEECGFRIPEQVKKVVPSFCELDFINLWYSKKKTKSQWHYDSYDNLLCVVKGVKRFSLISPNQHFGILKYEDLTGNFYNQGQRIHKAPLRKKKQGSCITRTVRIRENEALYLPKGWHHCVSSFGEEIIAINFWFRSVERRSSIASINSNFYVRYILHSKLEGAVKEQLERIYKSQELGKLKYTDNSRNLRKDFRNLFETAPQSIRKLIISLIEKAKLKGFLKAIGDEGIELLLQKFEDIDTKLLINGELMPKEIHKYMMILSSETDAFYKIWAEGISSEFTPNEFLECRKRLRENLMKLLIINNSIQN